ncbi:hypothetical protein [Spirillospora sp. NPDC029432]|uniref:hypothetical protein n=1 Tax=Spirillospora sp. NPDC029432 TaxID=3154599 RepID=UPI0034543544
MGVDWVRMRPRPGTDPAELAHAVRAEAAEFAASGHWIAEEFDHLPAARHADPHAGERAGERRPRVAALVDADTRPGAVHRIVSLALTPLLPAEWRFAAHRTHLPHELPARAAAWRAHIDQVRTGAHRPYLRAWHAYGTARRLADDWETLRALALAARERGNAWARRPELVDVRERILAHPVPPVPPQPAWNGPPEPGAGLPDRPAAPVPSQPGTDGPPPPDTGLPPDTDLSPDGLLAGGAAAAGLAREWNRRVPAGQKVRVHAPRPFDVHLADALQDPGLADTLDWATRAADAGFGLLLDW